MKNTQPSEESSKAAVRTLLMFVGENPDRQGLQDTPRRVIEALREMTVGTKQDPGEILSTVFEEKYDEMVVVRGIEYSSLCEHHLMPFAGTCDIGYVPDGKIVGLSKIPRLVECFARRLQVQERMTSQIAEAIETHLKPLGVGVVIRGRHSCCEHRGVGSRNEMITSDLRGVLRSKPEARAEFLAFAR
jgi:GTP cyclohydrolase I